jgi:hypothetical protein
VRSASEVEQNIVSVEHILHQTPVEPEASHEIPDTKPDGLWPSQGAIEFRWDILILVNNFSKLSHDFAQKLPY